MSIDLTSGSRNGKLKIKTDGIKRLKIIIVSSYLIH